jgi:hypothetical protein
MSGALPEGRTVLQGKTYARDGTAKWPFQDFKNLLFSKQKRNSEGAFYHHWAPYRSSI